MRGRRWLLATAFSVTLTVGGVLAVGQSMAAVTTPVSGAADSNAAPTIAWNDCSTVADPGERASLQAAGAQCGQMVVPLDYNHPHGRHITVALSRIHASDPAHRRGVLVLNPGGPGDAALALPAGLKEGLPDVAARYDLVGMDPRFVGASSPVTCRWPTDFPLRSAGPDRWTFGQGVSFMRDLAAGCAGGNADLLPYASTRNTARDIDLVRAALGEPRVSYIGWSYGSYLGSVYTQMFPQRVDRFVFDSAVNPDAYATGLWPSIGPATEAALRNWAGWAAARDATYHLGTTVGQVLASVDGIYRAAGRAPLRVGSYRVDSHVLPVLLFIPIRIDTDDSYAAIAGDVVALKTAAAGTPVDPTDELAANLALIQHPTSDTTAGATSVIFCADQVVSRDPETYYRDIQAHRADEPHFGALTRNVSPCTFWPTAPVEAPTRISNNVPVLMVGSTGDPRSPYQGQLNLHRELAGSRLITLAGAFEHIVYGAEDNACITDTVGAYLLDGTLPASDVTCHRAGSSSRPGNPDSARCAPPRPQAPARPTPFGYSPTHHR